MSDAVDNPLIVSPDAPSSPLRPMKWFFILGGVVAAVIGVLILLWPTKSAIFFTLVLATYAVVGGLLYAAIALMLKGLTTSTRIAQSVAALVLIATGVIAFVNPARSAATFAVIVVVFIAMAWIFEGIAAIATVSLAPHKGWTVFYAVVSILAGIGMLLSPLFVGAVLWMWLGIALVVIGVVQLARGLSIGRA